MITSHRQTGARLLPVAASLLERALAAIVVRPSHSQAIPVTMPPHNPCLLCSGLLAPDQVANLAPELAPAACGCTFHQSCVADAIAMCRRMGIPPACDRCNKSLLNSPAMASSAAANSADVLMAMSPAAAGSAVAALGASHSRGSPASRTRASLLPTSASPHPFAGAAFAAAAAGGNAATLFMCPEPGCGQTFVQENEYDDHCLMCHCGHRVRWRHALGPTRL